MENCCDLERSDADTLALVRTVCRALINEGQAAVAVECATRASQVHSYQQPRRKAIQRRAAMTSSYPSAQTT